jgi:hypothetical protein
MAQTNYTPIYLYNSGTATNTPLAANLGAGELAINYTDGKLFYKDNNAAIQVIGWKTTPTTAGGTGLTSYTAGDLPYYASGSALSKLGIGTANYVLTSSGTAPQYVAQSTLSVGSATNATNTAITDNTSSSATWYPTIVSATTGNLPQTTSSTKLSFVPSTGTLTATSHAGAWAGSTIGTTYGGTGLTSFTANGVVYASSTSVLATSSAFTFNGTDIGFTGNLIPGTAAKGVNFTANTPVAGMTSQLLNWYEEGTWTPNQGSGLTVVGAFSSTGKYTRIGRQVTIQGTVSGATSVAIASGALIITSNLPFSSNGGFTGIMYNSALSSSPGVVSSANFLYSIGSMAATTSITFSVTYFV